MAELLMLKNNVVSKWVFTHGVWGYMPDETEAFMMHYGLDFEICGYKKDPRENRRHKYMKKYYNEFTPGEIAKIRIRTMIN